MLKTKVSNYLYIKKALALMCALFVCIGNLGPVSILHAEFVDTYTPAKTYPINFTSAVSIQDDGFEQNQSMFATRFTTAADITTLQAILETGGAGTGIFIAINAGNLEVYIGDGNDLELTTPILANTSYTILLYADKDTDVLELYLSTTATSINDIGIGNSTKVSQTGWTDPDWDGGNNMGVYVSASSIQGNFTGTNPFLGTPLEGVSVYNGQTPLLDGCTDPTAFNYASGAIVDNGLCLYEEPLITLQGDSTVTVIQDDTYIDTGATATDYADGDITVDIVTVNPVDTAVLGTYTITYNVVDSESYAAVEVIRTVNVVEPPVAPGITNTPPTITSYSGSSSHTIPVGSGSIDVANISSEDSSYNVVGEYGTSSLSGNTWQQINTYEMCSPVVNISHRQDVNGEVQRAPRVRAKTGTGFEVHVDNYDSTIGAISTDIDYVVLNAGTHNFAGGLLINAGSQSTSTVACNASNSPTPTAVTFGTTFSSAPVVTHTISTENDSTWLVSGVNGNNGDKGSEPLIGGMGTVLQRSFNSCTHAPEDVDYIAIEPGTYTLSDGTIMDAVRSTDSIASVTTTGNPITFGTAFSSAPNTVLVSQLGEDGGNGGYAQIHTGGGVSSSVVNATIDEDGPAADRNHTNEVVSSLAFDKSSGQFWEDNTISYSITGGADSAEFTINGTTGDLDFIIAKPSGSTSDANADGIYEVIVSACDSHCNSACSTQTILANMGDGIAPTITSINHSSGSLLPGGNHDIILDYSDNVGGSGVDVTSEIITLQKWNGTSWDADISATGFATETISTTQATYPTNNLLYGKYRVTFSINDNIGNTSTLFESIFYIDTPKFIVSTPEIDIGNINHLSPTFSPEVTITIKTVGAGFSVFMNRNIDLINSGETINSWNGSDGYGYDKETYTNNINVIAVNQNIATQTNNINTNGELNIYTYKMKMGALVDESKIAGEYKGNIDFGIELDY